MADCCISLLFNVIFTKERGQLFTWITGDFRCCRLGLLIGMRYVVSLKLNAALMDDSLSRASCYHHR